VTAIVGVTACGQKHDICAGCRLSAACPLLKRGRKCRRDP
jgi:hypothetical protein